MTPHPAAISGADDRVLRIMRMAVAGVAGALVVGFVTVLVLCRVLDRPELLLSGPWTGEALRAALDPVGILPTWLFAYHVALEVTVAATGCVAAIFVLRSRPTTSFTLYVAFALVYNATAGGSVPTALGALYPQYRSVTDALLAGAWLVFFPLAYLFPDGRFVPRWGRWATLAWLGLFVVIELLPTDFSRSGPVTAVALVLLASGLVAQVYRYRSVAGPTERRQMRWVLAAVALRFLYMLALLGSSLIDLINETSSRGVLVDAIASFVSYGIAALFPASVAVAIVRHRLFDVDVLISRTLVYSGLSVFVVGVYVVIVQAVGSLLQIRGNGVLPVLATAVVALAFSPTRELLQRHVTRLVFGHRGEPGAMVAELVDRLGSAVPSDQLLNTIVDSTGKALRLDRVQVVLASSAETARFPRSDAPEPGEPVERFELRYDDFVLGELQVWTRGGEPLIAAENRLLHQVAAQAGLAVRAAALTVDLQRSRERLLFAQEEERRRLHRDLHDGLGPTLASLYQRVDVAIELTDQDPEATVNLLGDVKDQIRQAIGEIRQLVYALRPPALDELGLVPALEDICHRLAAHPSRLHIHVTAHQPLPPLPAVIEVVAYRIVVEAVTNTVRHAAASSCTVHLAATDHGRESRLLVSVTDDGVGLPQPLTAGVGIRSMHERADEVGGTVSLAAHGAGGTAVHATLPLAVRG